MNNDSLNTEGQRQNMTSDIIRKKIDSLINRKLQNCRCTPGSGNPIKAVEPVVRLSFSGMAKPRLAIVYSILLLLLILISLSYSACTPADRSPNAIADQISVDQPAYTHDEVLAIAKEFSPECRVQKRAEGQSP